jgi:predicted enzyme related to lactoylglutathione lyase
MASKIIINHAAMNLNQITIPVSDVARAIVFYEKLGLQLIVIALPNYARMLCPDGNATFSLHQVEQLPVGNGVWIYFEVKNVDEIVNQLQSEGISFETEPQDQPWLWREASLKDPDQNHIIIYHAGENRLNPPWRIN